MFNLNPLQVIFKIENFRETTGTPDLIFEDIYGGEVTFPLKFIMNTDPEIKPKPDRQEVTWVMIIVIVIIILAVMAIFLGVVMVSHTKGREDIDTDLNLDDVEQTMKLNQEDSITGDTSKL